MNVTIIIFKNSCFSSHCVLESRVCSDFADLFSLFVHNMLWQNTRPLSQEYVAGWAHLQSDGSSQYDTIGLSLSLGKHTDQGWDEI